MEISWGTPKKKCSKKRRQDGAKPCLVIQAKKDYKGMVKANLIPNCPITPSDVINMQDIVGPDLGSILGKMVRQSPGPVVADYMAVPCLLVEANMAVTLAAVDRTALLVTVSQRIKFVTAEHMPVRMATSLIKHLMRILLVYGRAGFRVRTILTA